MASTKRSAPNKKKSVSQTASTRKASSKPTVKQAVSNPAKYAASAKIKKVPYSKLKPRKETNLDKVAVGIAGLSPIWVAQQAFNLVSGIDTDKPMYDKSGKYIPKSQRKTKRLSNVANLAFAATSLPKAKKIKKAYKTARQVNNIRSTNAVSKQTNKTIRQAN